MSAFLLHAMQTPALTIQPPYDEEDSPEEDLPEVDLEDGGPAGFGDLNEGSDLE